MPIRFNMRYLSPPKLPAILYDGFMDPARHKAKPAKLSIDAAGRHLTTNVPVIYSGQTIGQAREEIYVKLGKYDTINYVYHLTRNNTLVGVFSLRELFAHPDETKIVNIETKRPIYSHPHTDLEKVAHKALKHEVKSIPIVDEHKHFLGIIASDTILATLKREYEEDFLKSAGIVTSSKHPANQTNTSIADAFLHRSPWIVIGLIGGILAAQVVGAFEAVLAQHIILAAFIPLIVYVGAAVAAQTQTLFIRDLVLTSKINMLTYALRQFFITILIGLLCGLVIWGIIHAFWNQSYLGFVIGLSGFIAITSSVITSLTVPYVLNSLGQDPANGSGPFATILQDILSILIYFTVATILL
jgi:magnesium transporter